MHFVCIARMSSQEIQAFVHTKLQSSMFAYFNFGLVVTKSKGLLIVKWQHCIAYFQAI